MHGVLWLVLKILLVFSLAFWLFRQVRKPSGLLGKRVVRAMNLGHALMTSSPIRIGGGGADCCGDALLSRAWTRATTSRGRKGLET